MYHRLGHVIGPSYPNATGNGALGSPLGGVASELELYPDLAADPTVAAKIAAIGLRDNLFTQNGNKLRHFIPNNNPTLRQFERARVLVNGSDQAGAIATRAMAFLDAMRGVCFPR